MYQFAQLMTFPALDTDYLTLLADHYREVHPTKSLDRAAMEKVFAHLGYKPALMKDLVKSMSADGLTNLEDGLKRYLEDDRNVSAWQGVFEQLSTLEQAVVVLLAHGVAPMAKDTLDVLAKIPGLSSTLPKVRAALNRMRQSGLLSKPPKGSFQLEDQLFGDYVAGKYVPSYIVNGTIQLKGKPPSRIGKNA